MKPTRRLVILSFLITLIAPAQADQCTDPIAGGLWKQGDLLTSGDGAAGDWFSYNAYGQASAFDSDGVRMIAGAIGVDINGFTVAGSAYIFDWVGDSWIEKQKLTPVNPATAGESTSFGGFLYGGSVSIDGDIAVVGEPEYNNNGGGLNLGRHGQATVYRYNSNTTTWEQSGILNAGAEEVFESNLGNSITVDADGAPGGNERILAGGLGRTSEGGFWTGKAYIFDWSGSSWQMTSLKNPAPSSNDYYGAYSDLDGNTALVGTASANKLAGEAWIFEFDGASWGAGISLHGLISNRYNQDRFGVAVAVDGDFAVVGAYDSNAGGDGSAYVFWNNPNGSWELFDTLTDDDGDTDDQFGKFVEIEGNRMMVSAANNEVDGTASKGSVYLYEFDGSDWVFKQQLNRFSQDGADGFAFGSTFAGGQILIGSGYDDSYEVNQGAVLVYDFVDELVFRDGLETCSQRRRRR